MYFEHNLETDKLENIWTIGASHYQALKGVHQPWIAEISPYQYAAMSKRAKGQYDEKRSREWDASAACKGEYSRLVVEAFTAGKFDWHDNGVHEDAQHVVLAYQREQKEEAAKARLDAARTANGIASMDEISIGDTVYDLIFGYVKVVKKSRLSCRVESVGDAPYLKGKSLLCKIGSLQRKSYNDVEKSVEQA